MVSNIAKKLINLKAIVLGEAAVGKTTLIKRFVEARFEGSYKATIGADIFVARLDVLPDMQARITIWDMAGQYQYRRLIRAIDGYFQKARIVMLVYDITRKWTFDAIEEWYQIALEKDLDPKEVIYLLVENKVDLEDLREVPPDAGEKLAQKLNLHGFIRTSAKTGYNVEQAFRAAVRKLVELALRKIKSQKTMGQ